MRRILAGTRIPWVETHGYHRVSPRDRERPREKIREKKFAQVYLIGFNFHAERSW
jgi:hypothetical protein